MPPSPFRIGELTITPQEDQHVAQQRRGQRCPQEAADNTTDQEDRPALPPRPGSHCPQPEGRNDQGRHGRHLQGVQEEGQ